MLEGRLWKAFTTIIISISRELCCTFLSNCCLSAFFWCLLLFIIVVSCFRIKRLYFACLAVSFSDSYSNGRNRRVGWPYMCLCFWNYCLVEIWIAWGSRDLASHALRWDDSDPEGRIWCCTMNVFFFTWDNMQ